MEHILSIETSCDDTSVAIIDKNREVLCCLVASQDLVHQPFGGVVPEIASRNHTAHILPLVDEALKVSGLGWDDISGLAVTNRPGLVGSLIVGLVTVKSLAVAFKKPFLGVHHIEGHIMAPFLKDKNYAGADFYEDPFVALVVSGGHSNLYLVNGFGHYEKLGETIDDAAGEAFDKFAKMLGLPYPGGVQVDRLASQGDPKSFQFPRPLMKEDHYNFSFSGLKSSAARMLESMSDKEKEDRKADLCASYQQAIVDVLAAKLDKAIKKTGVSAFVVTGGVSANSGLRSAAEVIAKKTGTTLALPPLRFCTDNAAMIGIVGLLRMQKGETSSHDLPPHPRAPL
ncbi:MAG: tRNA (adenosine(37)-N6)-threonylcarbamoyltransferase complex transferase subunit TsaD [Pseudomonadota bacterium]